MSYIDKHLIAGEEVLYEGQISLWSQAKWLILGVLGITFIFYNSRYVLIPFAGGVCCFLWVIVQFATTELAVTSKRVVAKYGWIARNTVEISLNRIESLEVDQPVHQRLLGYGSVYISGTGSHKARIANVVDPMAFRQAFLEAVDSQEGESTELLRAIDEDTRKLRARPAEGAASA